MTAKFLTRSAMRKSTSSCRMQSGSQSRPKRITTRRSSSERIAWSTCQPVVRWGRTTEPIACLFLGGATERVVEEGMIAESEGLSLYFVFLSFFSFCGFLFPGCYMPASRSQ
ncbi:hypothetical protein I7I50_01838 [Histoplasma capsulatum G186AR]|uniref:Uncharacterized protein n=1 Tax=Ajellomyces capsulatus TaxID=5037 RepID=A0A8H7YA26_AJECA|nr:hypothetical protein I7I52_12052 [Histoplasma capsulatum]QSS71110.1 hypothetical protein I7I50_01838 [Histoplasma capsulatum G186AR]